MNKEKPTDNKLGKKLSETEEHLVRLQKNKIKFKNSKHYTAILSTKELAEAYIASEQNFKNSIDTCPLGIRIVTEDGVLIYANEAALDIFGYHTVEELALVKRHELYTPESYAAHLERKRKRKLKQDIQDEYEISIKRPDGEVRNLMVFRREVMWGGEKQYMAMYEDITERKKAEESLRESEEKYHNLIEHSNDGIVFIEEGVIGYCNPKMFEISGYTTDELYGKPFIEFIAPKHKEKVAEIYKKRIAGLKVPETYELDIISKKGNIIHTEINARLFYFRQKLVDIAILRDITERKKVEDALRESEEKYHSIVEQALVGIGLSKGNEILFANKALLRVFNYDTLEEFIKIPLIDHVAPSSRQSITERMRMIAEGKEPASEFEYDILCKGGGTKTLRASATHVTSGGEVYTHTVFQDITERKQAEEALRESEEMFSLAFRGSPNLILITSLKEGRIIEANDTYCRTTGYTREELIGHTTMELDLWYDPEQRRAIIEALQTRDTVTNAEVKFREKSGKMRTVLFSMSKITLKNEPCLISIAADITEQKQAEEELKSRERFLDNIIEKTPNALWVSDEKGTIIRINQALRNIFHVTDEEVIGKYNALKDSQIIEQGFLPLVKCVYDEGKTVSFTMEYDTEKVKQVRFTRTTHKALEAVMSAIKNEKGKVINVICQMKDITEQEKAKDALQESEARFRLIFENSKDAILLTSPEGEILAANAEACRMFGRTEEEICRIGRGGVIDTSDPRLEPALEKRRLTGEFSGELIGIRADGKKFPIDISSRIFYDKEGKARTSMIIRDISERKKMEEALEAEKEEVKLIIDSTPILVFYKDIKGKFIRVNKAFAAALNMTEEDMLGKTVYDQYSKDIAQAMTNDDNEVFKSGLPKLNIIEQYESANGLRWVQTDKIPIFDKDGGVIGLVGFAQDITERKRAEEAVKESEERFNKAFQASPNMMAVLSLEEGRFIDVNTEHTRISGYERREVIGKTTLELNLWAFPDKRMEFYKILNTEGRLKDYEILMHTKSGEIKTLQFSAEKIMLRGINCMVISALDITERKEAEERINHLNLTLRSIRNVSQIITREKDRSLLIQKVCDTLVETQSFKNAWIVLMDNKEQPTIWAGANVPKEFPALIELMKQDKMPQCIKKAMKQKQAVVTEDRQTTCKDCPALGVDLDIGNITIRLEIEGKTYGVLSTSIPKKLVNDKEEISLFTEIATDIAFALRDIELVAANNLREQERLRMAKMESIGMLAGGIAHDFNNLLTGIMGNIGLVKTYISPSDPTYEMLDEAEVAAVRARDLTQQLLTFAKGGKPVKKLINAAEVIKESAEFALRGSKAKLEISFPDDLWQIEADEGQIGQVINNLVINADEAMPMGGTLKITAQNLALKKSDAIPLRGGNYVRIEIKDTGIGISPKHIQRIFEPYFTTKQKGSGLGLTTAYSIVKNHGGIILVESVQNEGSTFYIYLSATKRALKGAKKLKADESGQAGGKVLIMDDEEIIRKMLKNMLSMAGYIVELSSDGAEALEKYEQAKDARDPFNAVIMDLTIPGGMGGKETIQKLLEIDPKATVIVSSGYATDPIMSDYKKYGFKAVIAKPYSVKQLRDLLSSLLTRKKR